MKTLIIFMCVILLVSISASATTFNATTSMSETTIQTGVTNACGSSGGIVNFAAGNYTGWTTQLNIPSSNGCIITGPTTGTPAILNSDKNLINATIFALTNCGSGTTVGSSSAIKYLTFDGTTSSNGTSAINVPSGCGGFLIDHIEHTGNDPTPGTTAQTAASIYMGGGNSNFAVTNSYFHDSCTQIDAHVNYTDYGGYCAATFISGTGSELNDIWSNNRVLTMEQGLKITQNSAAVGNLTVIGNSYINWHRIAIEIQSGGTNATINNTFNANYFGPPLDPCYLTYAMSIPMNDTGSPASTANDNIFITPNAVACGGANNHYGIAIEIWGNGVISQGNLIEGGSVANSGYGFSLGHGDSANITGNIASGYFVMNNGLIGLDSSAGAITNDTISPNTTTLATPTITIPTPVISPSSSSVVSPPIVTITDSRANVSIFYTIDGSTPTTASTLYTGPFTAPTLPATVKAIAQWGIGANTTIAFPSGFGYTPSTATTAVYTATTTPTSVTTTPGGAFLQTNSSFTFAAVCAPLSCSSYTGGVTWSSSYPTSLTVSSSGVATWTLDVGQNNYGCGYIVASVGGVSGKSTVCGQHIGDTWITYITPDPANFNQNETGTAQPLYLTVGSTAALGLGMSVLNSGQSEGAPLGIGCTWQTSDASVATVNSIGDVTAVAPGNVTITCGLNGNAVYGTSPGASWVSPGNVINFVVRAGGTSNITWYVRPDGGTPFVDSETTPFGQCTGKTNAPYPGFATDIWRPNTTYALGTYVIDGIGDYEKVTTAGISNTTGFPAFGTSTGSTSTDGTVTWTNEGPYPVNQACAMQNIRYLWSTEVGYISLNWMISGGDTILIAPNPAGYNAGGEAFNTPSNCHGNNFDCYMPSIPSGSSTSHTKILGSNYQSCTNDNAKTLLDVTYLGTAAINVKDSQYVDIACLEITDRSQSSPGGAWIATAVCPLGTAEDCGAPYAIVQSALTSNVTYTDLFMHGQKTSIFGAAGLGIVANRVKIQGEYATGIDMDDHPFNYGNMSTSGGFTLTNSVTQFSGCLEEYPIVHNYPYVECRDQNNGGQGDGFGTANTSGVWFFDHDIWLNNFQDGLDLLHSGMHQLTVTNSQSTANDGQAYKLGSADTVLFQNNIAAATCDRLLELYGDEPSTAITTGVSPCRANGTNVLMSLSGLGTYQVEGNTFTGNNNIHIELECEGNWQDCAGANTSAEDNVFLGFLTPDHGTFPTAYFEDNTVMPGNNGFAIQDHNLYYSVKNCGFVLGANETCGTVSPEFVNQPMANVSDVTVLDNFNYNPTSLIAGITLSDLSLDITGSTRATPPSLGAVQYFNLPATTTTVISAKSNTIEQGQAFNFTAAVSPNPQVGVVTFKDGITVLGSVSIEPMISAAPFTISSLALGSHSITATYTPLSNFGASTSTALSVTVNTSSIPVLQTISITPLTASIPINSTQQYFASCLYSDNSTSPCNIIWSDSNNHSSVNTTGIVTGISAGTDTITATISTIFGTATVTIIPPPPFIPFQGGRINGVVIH